MGSATSVGSVLKCRPCHLHHPFAPTGMVSIQKNRDSVSRRDVWMFLTRLTFKEKAMAYVHPMIRVSIDVGCHNHSVAIGLSEGQVLDEFEIEHNSKGFKKFFEHVEKWETKYAWPVSVAMEGFNGYARPLDKLIRARNYRLFNINNLKLARFKEIFPAAAKTDQIDARKGLELFQLREHLPMAKDVLQEIAATPKVNDHLKRLTRRRRRLVNERVSVVNSIQTDIQAVCPGLLEITKDVSNVWFLNFLTSSNELQKLLKKRHATLLKIPGVGKKYAGLIEEWQEHALFSEDIDIVSPMILEDAERIKELNRKIKQINLHITQIKADSKEASIIQSLPGFGDTTSAELAGEIGTVQRFTSESSLALYLGMASLDNSSGKYKGSKRPKHVNTRAKAAMMTAVDRHRKGVPESQKYYEKKRHEGKTHNQAIRALGRHLCRVIFKLLKEERAYEFKK